MPWYDALCTVLATLLLPTFLSDTTLAFSNSLLAPLFAAALAALFHAHAKARTSGRLGAHAHALGLLFACMTAAGHSLAAFGTVSMARVALGVLVYAHVFGVILGMLWIQLARLEERMAARDGKGAWLPRAEGCVAWIMRRPASVALVLVLCWLPAFLAEFPGGFRYDATAELDQIANGFSGAYPVLHSAIVTRLLPAVHALTGSYNAGVATYVSIQLCLFALMYSRILATLWRRGLNAMLLLVLLLYCGLFPVIQMLVVQELRDVLFGGLVTWLAFLSYLAAVDGPLFWESRWRPTALGLTLALTILSRSSGVQAAILAALVAACVLVGLRVRRQSARGAAVFVAAALIGYLGLGTFLTSLCQPMEPAPARESLSLMSQSLARAYLYERDRWTPEELQTLSAFMDLDDLQYVPDYADCTKRQLKLQDDDVPRFALFWLEVGTRHPKCYLDAILANSQGMWWPDAVIDGYKHYFTHEGDPYYADDKCYFSIGMWLEDPAVHQKLLPGLEKFYASIGRRLSFERIPIVSMLFSIGFQFWVVLHALFYLSYRKERRLLPPVAIVCCYMLAAGFVPIVLLRYFAGAFLSMPLVVALTLQPTAAQQPISK